MPVFKFYSHYSIFFFLHVVFYTIILKLDAGVFGKFVSIWPDTEKKSQCISAIFQPKHFQENQEIRKYFI